MIPAAAVAGVKDYFGNSIIRNLISDFKIRIKTIKRLSIGTKTYKANNSSELSSLDIETLNILQKGLLEVDEDIGPPSPPAPDGPPGPGMPGYYELPDGPAPPPGLLLLG